MTMLNFIEKYIYNGIPLQSPKDVALLFPTLDLAHQTVNEIHMPLFCSHQLSGLSYHLLIMMQANSIMHNRK